MDAHSTTLASPVMGTLEWKEAVRFDSTDWGWIIMSIGMAIGAGIVFLPVQVGLMGLWVFLLSAVIGYLGMYMFHASLSTPWPPRRSARITPASSPATSARTGVCCSARSTS